MSNLNETTVVASSEFKSYDEFIACVLNTNEGTRIKSYDDIKDDVTNSFNIIKNGSRITWFEVISHNNKTHATNILRVSEAQNDPNDTFISAEVSSFFGTPEWSTQGTRRAVQYSFKRETKTSVIISEESNANKEKSHFSVSYDIILGDFSSSLIYMPVGTSWDNRVVAEKTPAEVDRLANIAMSHPRVKELIEFILKSLESTYPGIESLINGIGKYKEIAGLEYTSNELDGMMNGIIVSDCNIPEKAKSQELV